MDIASGIFFSGYGPVMIYSLFLIINTGPQKLVVLIFIVFK